MGRARTDHEGSEPACQGCDAAGSFSVHTASALLSVSIDRDGLPEFDLDQIVMDIEMECTHCGRAGTWGEASYAWWPEQTRAERAWQINRARRTSTHFGEAEVHGRAS
jgi:hypothetical protein